MRKTLAFTFVALLAVLGLSIFIHKYTVKRRIAEYEARVASAVITTDSVSLQRTLLDTSYIAKYTELNDSNIEQYIDDWYKASKAHQSKNIDTSLTLLYNKVINYYNRRTDPQDILYEDEYFSKADFADSSDFYVIPENVRIHNLQTYKKDKEWYRHINVFSDSISYDVPVIDNGKPVLYLSDADDTILSNYLSWIFEWRDGDAYYEERHIEKEKYLSQYTPVEIGGDIPGYYRLYTIPSISSFYYYGKDILISVRVTSFYGEKLLLRDSENEFEVVSRWQI